jgi:DNA-binding GntR family transcriptional regulator
MQVARDRDDETATVVDATTGARSVYRRLYAEILAGHLDPGKAISQIKLAERLGVSRTPLREALRMLERDGLVHSEPNRRVRVTPVSVEDLEQLYALRVTIEALAIRLTVPRLTEEDIDGLRRCLDEVEAAAATRDIDAWEEPHREFHRGICSRAGARITRAASDLGAHSDRYRRIYLAEPIAWASTVPEHRAILEACESGDGTLAADRLARHLARTALTVIAAVAPEHDALPLRIAVLAVGAGVELREEPRNHGR